MGTGTRHLRATLVAAVLGGTALLATPVTASVVLHPATPATVHPAAGAPGATAASATTAHKNDHDADASRQKRDRQGDDSSTATPATHRGSHRDDREQGGGGSNGNSSQGGNTSSSNNANNSQSGSNGSSLVELNNVLENSLNGISIHVLGS